MNTFSNTAVARERHVASLSAVRGRNPRHNLWFFDSPKNDLRLTIAGDLAFYLCVLLEADPTVARYSLAERENSQPTGYILVDLTSEETQLWGVRRSTLKAQGRTPCPDTFASSALGASMTWKDDSAVRGLEIMIDNWLLLCAAMTRCRSLSIQAELSAVRGFFKARPKGSLAELIAIEGADRSCMLAAIGRLLQKDLITFDSRSALLSEQSQFAWKGVN